MAATFSRAKIGPVLLWTVLAVLLCTAILWYVGSRYEWAEHKVRTGFTGEARRNPLHAAQLLFEQLGMPAHKISDMRDIWQLPTNATLLLWSAQAFDKDQAERLAQWVERGGHVVLDADSFLLNERLGIDEAGTYRAVSFDEPLTELSVDGRSLAVEISFASLLATKHPVKQSVSISGGKIYWFPSSSSSRGCAVPSESDADGESGAEEATSEEYGDSEDEFAESDAGEADSGPRSGNVLLHYALGAGHVTAVGALRMFDNASIANYDHAEYLTRIVRLAGVRGPIYLAPDPHFPSLFTWLRQNAWPALVAAVVLLLAWLWRFMPRFGPYETPPPSGRPGLLQHLRAVAEFHLKGNHFGALLAPLQEDCLRALHVHAAREGSAADPVALAQRLTGLPAAEIERALRAAPAHRNEFLHHASTLTRIRDALTPSHRHVVTGPNL